MDIKNLPFSIIREREPSLILGWSVSLFAVILFVIIAFTMFYIEDYTRYSSLVKNNPNIILVFVYIPAFFLSKKLLSIGKKIRAVDAVTLLEKDGRRPILFLRSFNDDIERDMSSQNPIRFEERLIKSLKKHGPVVAIGKPGEKLPEIGAARLYVTDKDWQTAVEYFMENSASIVIMVGSSEGVWWEIERALMKARPENLHFFFPYTMSSQTSWITMQLNVKVRNSKARVQRMNDDRNNRYVKFKNRVQPAVDKPLPETLGDNEFLTFDRNWNPRLSKSLNV